VQGGYDAGYLYECAIGPQANHSAEIVASEPLRVLPIEDCNDVPVSCMKIRSALSLGGRSARAIIIMLLYHA